MQFVRGNKAVRNHFKDGKDLRPTKRLGPVCQQGGMGRDVISD
jgi:hypothetical protein